MATPSSDMLKEKIRSLAFEVGFDQIGFARPDAVAHLKSHFEKFLELGRQGSMEWLERRADERSLATSLWPEVRTVIMLGLNYGPECDPLYQLERGREGTISVYAQGKDYHDLIKKRLKRIAREIHGSMGGDVKVFVDTAPVFEKPYGQAAGIGWQGKHTNLVSPEFGSWIFLGSIFTTLDLEADAAQPDQCGSCHRCLDICPTKAFPAPYELDARRCISYLTIELKGHIPLEFRRAMGNRIYGCDDCLAVCPWNKFAVRTKEIAFHTKDNLTAPLLAELAELEDAAFRTYFSGSPVKRVGRDRFVRNVMIAIGNSGDANFRPLLEDRLHDTSPLVRAMAIWALGEILSPDEYAALKPAHEAREADPEVLKEWQRR